MDTFMDAYFDFATASTYPVTIEIETDVVHYPLALPLSSQHIILSPDDEEYWNAAYGAMHIPSSYIPVQPAGPSIVTVYDEEVYPKPLPPWCPFTVLCPADPEYQIDWNQEDRDRWVHFDSLTYSATARPLSNATCNDTIPCARDLTQPSVIKPSEDGPPDDLLADLTAPAEQMIHRLMRLKFTPLNNCRLKLLYITPKDGIRTKTAFATYIADHISTRTAFLRECDAYELMHELRNVAPHAQFDPTKKACTIILQILRLEYGSDIVDELLRPDMTEAQRRQAARVENNLSRSREVADAQAKIAAAWPEMVPEKDILDCCEDYVQSMRWEEPSLCACCIRRRTGSVISYVYIPDSCRRCAGDFIFDTAPRLNGLMLDNRGVVAVSGGCQVALCSSCASYLQAKKIPKYSLRNYLYRGHLPEKFADLTWIEEMVCAKYRCTAQVTRIFHSVDEDSPFVFHGNTCAHDMNVVSTATVLPQTPADLLGQLSVIFVGPGPIKPDPLRPMFRVRKQKVWDFLCWLKQNNELYTDLELSEENMSLYPEDDLPPGLLEAVIHDEATNVRDIIEEETAGFSEHPSQIKGGSHQPINNSNNQDAVATTHEVFIESMGVMDAEGDHIPGRTYRAAAIRNLFERDGTTPDLVIRRGLAAVSEYNNPLLVPGMFPTLFPYGIGGFDDSRRSIAIQLDKQANYYFDTFDTAFRSHRLFMFVVLNIFQRRCAHLHTYLTTRKAHFDSVADQLNKLSPDLIRSVADHLEHERPRSALSAEQLKVLDLLKKVDSIAARVPGSQASKIYCRNEIRAYMGYFGLPHIYLTMNPNPYHSPVFQVMVGDKVVDLTSRYPHLVPGRERAIRLASDPVAAADFFDFVLKSFFEKLLGWDPATQKSSERGGVLGRLKAYYGTAEYNERGCLHGHFLVWLDGGVNPSDLHRMMRADDSFKRRFFEFFDSVIHHHLPETPTPVDPDYEPRVECPPIPSNVDNWREVFSEEIKACGEALQRHHCRPVCHKYGHTDDCRFGFPHDVVESAFFDPETNSVYLTCRDPTVNYFNPYILVFCRHNHDIKCILSGRAARAAMFYITDYITKMDVKTHQMLSCMSQAVACMPDPQSFASPKEQAKLLLHKCLSQFTRQQQIHAQQAVRYLRGLGDSICSHKTIPMLSSSITTTLKSLMLQMPVTVAQGTLPSTLEHDQDADELTADIEKIPMALHLDASGQLCAANQVVDYLHRDRRLSDICFYDFVRFWKKVKKGSADPVNVGGSNDDEQVFYSPSTCSRLGRPPLPRFALESAHPQSESHELMQICEDASFLLAHEFVPRVTGCSIPRKDSTDYAAFMLAHFRPFTADLGSLPLCSAQEELRRCHFTSFHLRIMNNWDAIHECEDERDAERLRRRATRMKEPGVLKQAFLATAEEDDEVGLIVPSVNHSRSDTDISINALISRYYVGGWFDTPSFSRNPKPSNDTKDTEMSVDSMDFSMKNIKAWTKSARLQDRLAKEHRRAAHDPTRAEVVHHLDTAETTTLTRDNIEYKINLSTETETGADALRLLPADMRASSAHNDNAPPSDPDALLDHISSKYSLNEEQDLAFRIAARHFIRTIIKDDTTADPLPLRMFLTGPGGTGKSWSVRALKDVMDFFEQGYRIRYLAPTGSAAALIDGTTIHSAMGIHIERKDKSGKSNRIPGTSEEDYSVIVDVKQKDELRNEWKHVDYILIDEVSMVSQQLLCDIDHALRYAKDCKDDRPFGGANMIFAGDFFQFRPVGGTSLYRPIQRSKTTKGQMKQSAIKARLGRIAWKSVDTVIEFSDQHRMKDDKEYANAVLRLRRRTCTDADVALFNTRVLRSYEVPNGIVIDPPAYDEAHATAIVDTNILRQTLNVRKATTLSAASGADLITCFAEDVVNRHVVSDPKLQDDLASLDVSSVSRALPGKICLYEGMPVILRERNLSTELKVTNGSQGTLWKLGTKSLPNGNKAATCALVSFPSSPIEVPGLPRGVFPIEPQPCTIPVSIRRPDAVLDSYTVSRKQLPIQPAFAVTGHSAQGKTLNRVVFDMRGEGSAAYVSASRATSRYGIYLLHPISIDDLNTSLPEDLKDEDERLHALAVNTLIRYGIHSLPVAQLSDLSTSRPAKPRKRKHVNNSSSSGSPLKKQKHSGPDDGIVALHASPSISDNLPRSPASGISASNSPAVAGSTWDSQNWSCAYDASFVPLLHLFREGSAAWRQRFRTHTPIASATADIFTDLESAPVISTDLMNATRDRFRINLHSRDPVAFRMPSGMNPDTSVAEIFYYHSPSSQDGILYKPYLDRDVCCSECHRIVSAIPYSGLGTICDSEGWSRAKRLSASAPTASVTSWLKVLNLPVIDAATACIGPDCKTNLRKLEIALVNPPAWLVIEANGRNVLPKPLPNETLSFRTIEGTRLPYKLRAVVYSTGIHFFTLILLSNGNLVHHDGQLNDGIPRLINRPTSSLDFSAHELTTFGSGFAHLYLYALPDNLHET